MDRFQSIRELWRDKRGAAMVEGVIVLPVFVIVLAAIIYFHRAYATKINMNSKARSCAWSYAVNGCQASSRQEGCPISEIGGERSGIFDGFGDSIEDTEQKNRAAELAAKVKKETGALDNVLDGANTIGLAILGLGEGIEARPSASFARPSILGGGTRTIFGSYSVMCNEQKRSPADLANAAYCSVSKSLPGCE